MPRPWKTIRESVNRRKVATVLKAVFVRLMLLGHSVLGAWRVVETLADDRYWLLTVPCGCLLTETLYSVTRHGGLERKWFSLCFLFYLLGILPAIWILELNLINNYSAVQKSTEQTTGHDVNTTANTAAVIREELFDISSHPWVVIIQESLVYLLVFGRWFLPRGEVSRTALSDLLIRYLGMASDIMGIFALFDEKEVRVRSGLTYAVLTIWSLSFVQFVPVLVSAQSYTSPSNKWITRNCGEHFVEVVVTCLALCLQDGPFLILRLYIMLHIQLVTYSILFFVIKNIVVILLIVYKLSILCLQLPGCYEEKGTLVKVINVDIDNHVTHSTSSVHDPAHFYI
ncbi:hypothetical protein ScPMuIL_003738 [Solemya velum]